MKCYNRKKKPKHWSKPKWKTRTPKTSKIKVYFLVSRGIRSKYKKELYNNPLINVPKFKILSRSQMISLKDWGDLRPIKEALKKCKINYNK